MKIRDTKIRTVVVNIEHHEIIEMLINNIRTHAGFDFTQFDEFKFEFVKEGNPEYVTRKIRCIAIKTVDETPPKVES